MKYFTIVWDAYDGQQWGMLPLSVQAKNEDEAKVITEKMLIEDGWEKYKFLFVL